MVKCCFFFILFTYIDSSFPNVAVPKARPAVIHHKFADFINSFFGTARLKADQNIIFKRHCIELLNAVRTDTSSLKGTFIKAAMQRTRDLSFAVVIAAVKVILSPGCLSIEYFSRCALLLSYMQHME